MHPYFGFLVLTLFAWRMAAAAVPAVSLDEAFSAAMSKSEVVRQSDERVYQAEEKISQVRGGIFPNLSFNLTHQIQPLPADPVAQQFSPSHQTTASFSLSQPLFRGLREFAGLSQFRHLHSAQEASAELLRLRLYQDVGLNYLNILTLEQDKKNLQEQADLYDKRVDELGARAKRGESNRTEVLSAQTTQSSLLAEMRLVEGQLENSRETFHFLTGLERDARLTDPDLVKKSGGPANLEKYIQKIEERPDIRAAAEQLDAAREAVSIAWGAHFPSVDAVGNYYLVRPGFLKDLKWDIGIRLTFPLFEGGATQSKIRDAVSKRKESELELERTRRAAQQEIRSLHQRLSARLEHMTRLKRAAELSRKNSELVQRDYRRGLTRNIDVQMALTELRIAQRSFDQARFSVQLDLLQLQAAAGMAPASRKDTTP